MKIRLQENQLCFVANHLSNIVAGQYFKLLHEIKSKVNAQIYQPTDLVEVIVDRQHLLNIYFDFGQKPEYLTAALNRDMKQILTEQFIVKLTDYQSLLAVLGVTELTDAQYALLTDEQKAVVDEGLDTQYVISEITIRDTNADQAILELMAAGRALLS